MEKLVELLNEFDGYWDYNGDYWPYMPWMDSDAYWYHKYYLISKEYWFIERLVENDKIDWRKFLVSYYEIAGIDWRWEDTYILETFDDYEQLLMYLAIQDEPISFLISILK